MNITLILFGIGIIFGAGLLVNQLRKLDKDFGIHCEGGKVRQITLLDKMDSVKLELGEKITLLDKKVFAIETVMNGRLKKRKR